MTDYGEKNMQSDALILAKHKHVSRVLFVHRSAGKRNKSVSLWLYTEDCSTLKI